MKKIFFDTYVLLIVIIISLLSCNNLSSHYVRESSSTQRLASHNKDISNLKKINTSIRHHLHSSEKAKSNDKSTFLDKRGFFKEC